MTQEQRIEKFKEILFDKNFSLFNRKDLENLNIIQKLFVLIDDKKSKCQFDKNVYYTEYISCNNIVFYFEVTHYHNNCGTLIFSSITSSKNLNELNDIDIKEIILLFDTIQHIFNKTMGICIFPIHAYKKRFELFEAIGFKDLKESAFLNRNSANENHILYRILDGYKLSK